MNTATIMNDWDRKVMSEAHDLWSQSYGRAHNRDDAEKFIIAHDTLRRAKQTRTSVSEIRKQDAVLAKDAASRLQSELERLGVAEGFEDVEKIEAAIEAGSPKGNARGMDLLLEKHRLFRASDEGHDWEKTPHNTPMFTAERARLLATWANAGYPILATDTKYAAALMCSDSSVLTAEDARPTWEAALIQIPGNLLHTRSVPYDRILLDMSEGRFSLNIIDPRDGISCHALTDLVRNASNVSDLIRGRDSNLSDENGRVIVAASRLVAGLLVTLQHTTNFRDIPVKACPKQGPWSRALPAHREYLLGRPIQTDFSDAVREFVSGAKRSTPCVQTLVRGHYKRQVIGVSRAGRKVIWIEPYWRGPEDAPILARPYKVGGTA